MALYIKITKISEKEGIGFYHVFTEAFDGANFYVGFDREFHKIHCFLTNNFSDPIRIIDLTNPDEVVGQLPGVKANILAKLFMIARKAFILDEFPQYLDYCAWDSPSLTPLGLTMYYHQDMTAAWKRLIDGNFIYSDLILLQHEYAESFIMQRDKIPYRIAHDVVNKTYNWENAYRKDI